ncbi:MAG: pyridoxal phosphate-dependent aminotransferase [Spirochaetia bacterium]|jgi:aspartate/methionine/tyrosine aminotransferase
MFSNRVIRNQAVNRLSRAREAKKAAGAMLLDLTESNPTRSGFHYEGDAIFQALARPDSLLYQPHPQGLPGARRAVADYYRERGVSVDADSLILASGTSEAYGSLFKLLANPGDEILVPVPGYPLLEVLTELESVRQVPYRLLYEEPRGWRIDMERLRNTISNRTVAIVSVSPNNPTGSFLKADELAEIGGLCRQFGLALIVDEVFADYGRGADENRVPCAAAYRDSLTFVLNGFSKIVGLPQMKLAWIHVSGPDALCRQAREHLEFINDAYLTVATPIQNAAADILRQRGMIQAQILSRVETNGSTLEREIETVPSCRLLKREGGWYAVLRLPDDCPDEDLAVQLLEKDDVLVHPGYFYDFPTGRFLVISLLTPLESFREGALRLAARLRGRA